MKRRAAAVVLLILPLLISFGWPGESWGQTKIPRVGIISFQQGLTGDQALQWYEPFRRTLRNQGWIEDQNLSFEYRIGPSDPSQFAEAAAGLVRLKVDVIFAASAPATRAAYAATHTIPIVALDFTNDPVAAGYAESYGRPGGNLTGIFLDAPEFAGKWLELLKALIPRLSRVVVLWDPSPGATHLEALQAAAPSFGVKLQVIEVRNPDDIDRAFSAFRGRPEALMILPSPMIYVQSERLAKLAMKHRLPATSMAREFAEAGGALAYGPDLASAYERSAVLVAKILGGAKPAELPVERPTKVQLVVNSKTVKVLGLTIPESILLRADDVIK
jgi:putative tryptophan/tyrosine transport system substrate-binding protein